MSPESSAVSTIKESRTLAYIIGAVTLAAGLVLLLWPDRTITIVARIAGLLLVIVGISDLFDTLKSHRGEPYWIILLLRSLFHLGYGAALLFWPHITVHVIVWLFGLDMVLTGILGFVVLGRLPEEYKPAMIMRSAVSIVFGILVLVWPSATLTVVAFCIAALLIGFGLVLLWSGRQLSKAASSLA